MKLLFSCSMEYCISTYQKRGGDRLSLRNSALDPLLVSKRDAAALLGVCLRSVDNYIATKELPARRLGKRVLIPYSALLAFARRDHVNPARSKASEISPERDSPETNR
jgi:excisionase family DNA binding protein